MIVFDMDNVAADTGHQDLEGRHKRLQYKKKVTC